jgi:hypothetical protein
MAQGERRRLEKEGMKNSILHKLSRCKLIDDLANGVYFLSQCDNKDSFLKFKSVALYYKLLMLIFEFYS